MGGCASGLAEEHHFSGEHCPAAAQDPLPRCTSSLSLSLAELPPQGQGQESLEASKAEPCSRERSAHGSCLVQHGSSGSFLTAK